MRAVFYRIKNRIGSNTLNGAFNTILTDRRGDFGDPDTLKTGLDGLPGTLVYSCDPMIPWVMARRKVYG